MPHFSESQPLETELLDRYLSGRATADERQRVEAWLANGAERSDLVNALRHPVAKEATATRVQNAWARFETARPADALRAGLQLSPRTQSRQRPTGPRTWMISGIAAVALAVGGITMIRHADMPTVPTRSRSYATSVGQTATITLADGSVMQLAPVSRVRFVQSAQERTVELDGEAYFVVHAKQAQPFVVRTGTVTTHVLGTTFLVRKYAADPSTRVVVIDGKIVAASARSRATLVAGDVAEVTDSTVRTSSAQDLAPLTGWTKGDLRFTDTPVPVVLATLGRWYGLEFRVTDPAITHDIVTGQFRTGALDETLASLGSVLGVTTVRDGAVVTLRPPTRRPAATRKENRINHIPPSEVGK